MILDAVVVGAGFAGLYALHKLRSQGLSVRVFEAAPDIGGTWYFNRYPGARCDVESVDYCYSFSDELQQEWNWTEKYATQPEILRYLNWVADKLDLRRDITFNTKVTSAVLDEQTLRWTVTTDTGETVTARFCVMATGALSAAITPKFNGLQTFEGELYHTAHWPHEDVDFTGKRVAVIGTGSSGIQSIPIIAEQAAQLYVFQRTPNYSVPAGNKPLTSEDIAEIKANYAERRRLSWRSGGGSPHIAHPNRTMDASPEERRQAFENRWQLGGVLFSKTFPDQMIDPVANEEASKFYEEKVRARHRRSASRRPADPQRPSDRHQTDLHRQQLLSDIQQAKRGTDQRAQDADRVDRRHRDQHHGRALRPRRDRAGHRFRRDDGSTGQDRHRRPRRTGAARRLEPTARAPIWALGSTGSPTCSSCRVRALRRCWPTWCCTPRPT